MGLGLLAMLAMAWPLLLLGAVAWFFFGRRKKGGADDANRLTGGLGTIRARTIVVGETVIAVNNIGSIAIIRGQQTYGMLIVGLILVLIGVSMLSQNFLLAILLAGGGAALIALNLAQKPDNGLSIGTCDGRIHIIVSTDNDFLGDLLDFIRRKVDTGDIKLQGRFDIGARHFNSEGGGIVIGDGGYAGGAGGEVRPRDEQ